MFHNKNTVLALLLTAAASMGGTVAEGADNTDHWTSTRLARQRKLKKAHSGGGGTNASTPAPTPTPPGYLFVQPGIECRITDRGATGRYLLSATVGNATIAFTERPDRLAGTIATQQFVDQFKDIFATSNPNAAVTFTTMASADNNKPLIVELSKPRMNGNIIEYPITQSISQGEVVSMNQFLGMSDVSCSIFIDSSNGMCVKSAGKYDSQKDHCYTCGGGDTHQKLGYCWNSQTTHCPPACDNMQVVSTQGDNDCGDACDKFAGVRRVWFGRQR